MSNITEIPSEVLVDNLLWLGYRGSIAHGTHVPGSDPSGIDDVDLIGVFVAPTDHYIGLNRAKETVERKQGEWDVVHYELRHFLNLLLKSNPSVLSCLWLHYDYVIAANPIWSYIAHNRSAFASRQAYPAFTGYAYAQLQRMTRLQEKEPEKLRKIAAIEEEIGYRESRTDDRMPMYFHPEYRGASLQSLRTERNNLKSQKGYMGEKRKALTEQHGYDTKNAAHLIRLLRMGIEFLETGEMQVRRKDADDLIAIKRGEWSRGEVEQTSTDLFTRAKKAVQKSPLPEYPDKEKANEVCMEILRVYTKESRAA